MAHLNLDDTKHNDDTNKHAAKKTESVKKITDVINQMIHLLKYEEQELVKMSTGHKAESTYPVRAREEGCSKRNRQKVSPQNLPPDLQQTVLLFLLFFGQQFCVIGAT